MLFISSFLIFSNISIAQGKANKLVEKGNEFLQSKNFSKAEECYSKALSIDSTCFEAYIQKSDIEIQNSQYEKALLFIDLARKFAELKNEKNESIAHIYSVRSFIYFNLDNFQKATEDLNNAISLNDQNSGYFYMRALIRRINSDLKGCCSDLKRASNLGLEKAKESLAIYCK